MDGIPVSVSAVTRTTPTSLFPFFAYSTKYIAEKIPIGPAIHKESKVIISVFIIAGSMDTFSVVYLSAKRSVLRFGIPFTKM